MKKSKSKGRRIEPSTRIRLELIIGRKKKFIMEGACLDKKPAMSTIFSYYTFEAVPEIDKSLLKKVIYDSTLHKKISLLTSYTNKNYEGKSYEIRMRVWEE